MKEYVDKERVLKSLPKPEGCETGDIYDYRDMVIEAIKNLSPSLVITLPESLKTFGTENVNNMFLYYPVI